MGTGLKAVCCAHYATASGSQAKPTYPGKAPYRGVFERTLDVVWADKVAIPERHLKCVKVALVVVIAVTSVLPLLFVTPDVGVEWHVNVFKYLAKTGAFLGSMFLIWQFFLGFRGAISRVFPDLAWIVVVHKVLGQFGVPVLLLHPIFIGLYYAEVHETNIFALDLRHDFSQFVLLGMVALAIVAFLTITSAFLRGRMGFYRWLYTHLSAYLVPPLLFIHSFLLGPTIQGSALIYYWWLLTGLVCVLFVYRIAHKLGAGSRRYRVTRTNAFDDETTEVLMIPEAGQVKSAPGQFIYLRESLERNSHPYTVSTANDDGTVGVTVRKNGPQSARLQDSQEGDRMLIDGPFGVFTRPSSATDLPTVLIAGGVGITAFRRLWQRFEEERDREVHLFYGNEFASEITYRDELEELTHVHVVHVLNQEPEFDGETGFVTVDVLRRHLPQELGAYQFLLCGPPPMVMNVEEELRADRVSKSRLRHELFDS